MRILSLITIIVCFGLSQVSLAATKAKAKRKAKASTAQPVEAPKTEPILQKPAPAAVAPSATTTTSEKNSTADKETQAVPEEATAPAQVQATQTQPVSALAAPSTSSEAESPKKLDAAPASSPWQFAVAPRIGLIIPTSKLGLFVLGGLEFDYFTPVFEKKLVAALDISYSRPGKKGEVNDSRIGGKQSFDLHMHQLKFALNAIYRFFPFEKSFIPFAGLGPVMVLERTVEDASFIPGNQKEQSTQFGFEVLTGVDYRLGPGFLTGVLRYTYAGLAHDLTGKSNSGSVQLTAGYRMCF